MLYIDTFTDFDLSAKLLESEAPTVEPKQYC